VTETEPGAISPDAITKESTETWRDTVEDARRERRQRGERYQARHRTLSTDSGSQAAPAKQDTNRPDDSVA
jgi:hypothetical protein